MSFFTQLAIQFLILPITLLRHISNATYSTGKKVWYIFLVLLIFCWTWITSFSSTVLQLQALFNSQRIVENDIMIQVTGTSMLPTVLNNSEIKLQNPSKIPIERGDIVGFANAQTRSTNTIARVIGLPGETIALQNGSVMINEQYLNEPYTLNNFPTYGNTTLLDCDQYTVPADAYAVLSDNRLIANDSRIFGFIAKADLIGVISKKQTYSLTDTPPINTEATMPLSVEEVITALNTKRAAANVAPLRVSSELNTMATARSKFVQQHLEDWKTSQLNLTTFLDEQKYRVNRSHELVTTGYLSPAQLIEQIENTPSELAAFTDGTYTDLGIGITQQQNGVCSYPIVTVLLTWPAEASYESSLIQGWKKGIEMEKLLLSDLQSWIGYPEKDQTKLRSAIAITSERISIATKIYNKMNNKEWLTPEDYKLIQRDKQLDAQETKIVNELFPE